MTVRQLILLAALVGCRAADKPCASGATAPLEIPEWRVDGCLELRGIECEVETEATLRVWVAVTKPSAWRVVARGTAREVPAKWTPTSRELGIDGSTPLYDGYRAKLQLPPDATSLRLAGTGLELKLRADTRPVATRRAAEEVEVDPKRTLQLLDGVSPVSAEDEARRKFIRARALLRSGGAPKPWLSQAVHGARELGMPVLEARATSVLIFLLLRDHRYEAVERRLETWKPTVAEASMRPASQAGAAYAQGEFTKALAAAEKAVIEARRQDLVRREVEALLIAAGSLFQLGLAKEAVGLLDIPEPERMSDCMRAWLASSRAWLRVEQHELEGAYSDLEVAEGSSRECRLGPSLALHLNRVAYELAAGRPDKARAALSVAQKHPHAEQAGWQADLLEAAAAVAWAQGQEALADRTWTDLDRWAQAAARDDLVASAALGRALILEKNKPEEALRALTKANEALARWSRRLTSPRLRTAALYHRREGQERLVRLAAEHKRPELALAAQLAFRRLLFPSYSAVSSGPDSRRLRGALARARDDLEGELRQRWLSPAGTASPMLADLRASIRGLERQLASHLSLEPESPVTAMKQRLVALLEGPPWLALTQINGQVVARRFEPRDMDGLAMWLKRTTPTDTPIVVLSGGPLD